MLREGVETQYSGDNRPSTAKALMFPFTISHCSFPAIVRGHQHIGNQFGSTSSVLVSTLAGSGTSFQTGFFFPCVISEDARERTWDLLHSDIELWPLLCQSWSSCFPHSTGTYPRTTRGQGRCKLTQEMASVKYGASDSGGICAPNLKGDLLATTDFSDL